MNTPMNCRIILWPLPMDKPFRQACVVGDDDGDTTIDSIVLAGATIEEKLAEAKAYAEKNGTNVEPLGDGTTVVNIHRPGENFEDHRLEPVPVLGFRFTLTNKVGALQRP